MPATCKARPQTFVQVDRPAISHSCCQSFKGPEEDYVNANNFPEKTSFPSELRHFIQHFTPPEITVQFVREKQSHISACIYTHALLRCSVRHNIVQPVSVHSVTSKEKTKMAIYLPLQLMEHVTLFNKPSSKFGVTK